MILYIESPSLDPHFNLALEQYLFDRMDPANAYFMLWQNDNAVIVGRHQNTAAEIDAAYVKEKGIRVVRRLSGGGAVYHDMGNLNFTFISDNKRICADGPLAVRGQDADGTPQRPEEAHNADDAAQRPGAHALSDFSFFCAPVLEALASFGVQAELSGRNDMTIEGKKFSGNAQYSKHGRTMHHGTIMYDSDLDVLTKALSVSPDKIAARGIASVRSRVTNVKPYLRLGGQKDISITDFREALKKFLFRNNDMREYVLNAADLAGAQQLRESVYDRREWNYGRSPGYKVRKQRRFEGCGSVEVYLDVVKGSIRDCVFFGDYFSNNETTEIARRLQNVPLEAEAVEQALSGLVAADFFSGLNMPELLQLLME